MYRTRDKNLTRKIYIFISSFTIKMFVPFYANKIIHNFSSPLLYNISLNDYLSNYRTLEFFSTSTRFSNSRRKERFFFKQILFSIHNLSSKIFPKENNKIYSLKKLKQCFSSFFLLRFKSSAPIRELIPLKNPRINYNFSPRGLIRRDFENLGAETTWFHLISRRRSRGHTLEFPLPNLWRKEGGGEVRFNLGKYQVTRLTR